MIAEIKEEGMGVEVSGLTLKKICEAMSILNANDPPQMFGPFKAPEPEHDWDWWMK